jgi:hypothetical protein
MKLLQRSIRMPHVFSALKKRLHSQCSGDAGGGIDINHALCRAENGGANTANQRKWRW